MQILGVSGAVSAYLASSLCKNSNSNGVFICQSEYDAKKLYLDLEFFYDGEVIFYPSKEIEFYESLAKSNELINERLSASRVCFSLSSVLMII